MRAWIALGLLTLSSCGASQSTLVGAERGLRIACAALAEAVVQGTTVPAGELAARACDVDRTKHLMLMISQQMQPKPAPDADHDLAPLDPQIFEASPGAPGDAGAP
jgi:hypothetical protein